MDLRYSSVFVDIVGFINQNHFICKEFSLIDGDFVYHVIIKPPYSLNKLPRHEREMALWEIKNLHGLEFHSGDVYLEKVLETVFPRICAKKVIVENSFKASALKRMFHNCGDLDCISIESLGFDMDLQTRDTYPICKRHNGIVCPMACECAFATSHRLKEISINNLVRIDDSN